MRCGSCFRNIAAGVEAQKMIVEYQQDDGARKFFGYMMEDGPLSAATGKMLKGFHHKCYWIERKREARGGTVTGRVVAGTPTGYDINQIALTRDDLATLGITAEQARLRSSGQLSDRVGQLRELAESLGKGVGDPQVQEAFAASAHGGPYKHHHEHRLETYQLVAHLQYAHGMPSDILTRTRGGLQYQHADLHAREAQRAITADRDETETRGTDWREQYTADIEEIS